MTGTDGVDKDSQTKFHVIPPTGKPSPSPNPQEIFSSGRFTFKTTSVSQILPSKGRDLWISGLQIPLPDIVFGSNGISIYYNSERGMTPLIYWSTLEALRGIEKGIWPTYLDDSSDSIKVAQAKLWGNAPGCSVSPHDWTFTSKKYHGTTSPSLRISQLPQGTSVFDHFDKSLLLRHDPIQYSKHVILYEDELGDHGTSTFSIRIRVMPNCFLLLARSYVKIEKVLIRAMETRLLGLLDHGPLYRDINSKEIRWTSDERLFSIMGCNSKEDWQALQSNEDNICNRLPVLESRSEVLEFLT